MRRIFFRLKQMITIWTENFSIGIYAHRNGMQMTF